MKNIEIINIKSIISINNKRRNKIMAIIYRLKVSEYIKNIEDIKDSLVVVVKKGSDKRLVLYFYPNIYNENIKKTLGEEKIKSITDAMLSIHKTNKASGKFKYDFYAQTLEGDEMNVARECLQVYNNKPSRRVKLSDLVQKNSSHSSPKSAKFSLKSAIKKKFHKGKK